MNRKTALTANIVVGRHNFYDGTPDADFAHENVLYNRPEHNRLITGMLAGSVLISILGTWRDRVKPILMAYLLIGVATLFVIAGAGALLCWLLNWLIPAARQYDQTLQQDER